jgi:selenocysteine lyase/cysteine desulfurase
MAHDLSPDRLEHLRADTPGVAHRRHLNNAGSSLPPRPVLDAVTDYLRLESEIGGYEAADAERERIDAVYDAVARLVGARPDEIGLVENATVAFAQVLSAIPFERGDRILTSRADYVSNQIMYLSLRDRIGVEVERVEDDDRGLLDLDDLDRRLAKKPPRLVALTHVPSHSGRVQPVAEVGKRCRERDVLYLVDACQSVGQTPVDVEAIGCDFLAATGRKFLRGPRGTGFVYASRRVLDAGLTPLLPDLHGADWTGPDRWRPVSSARRFENWEFSYALLLGLGAAARYALDVGLEVARARSRRLADLARRRLGAVDGVRCLEPEVPGDARHSLPHAAIATFAVEGDWGDEGEGLQDALRERRLNTSISHAEDARYDLGDDTVPWTLRVSPHYFNTEDEVEALAEALAELVDC